MTKRLTKEWTPTLEGAFGRNGKVGELAEEIAVESFRKYGYTVNHYSDAKTQNQGIDIDIKKDSWNRPYTANVKSTTTKDTYNMYLKSDWLKCKTDRIVFFNHNNPDWLYWFDIQEMNKYITDNNLQPLADGAIKIPLGNSRPKVVRCGKTHIPPEKKSEHEEFFNKAV